MFKTLLEYFDYYTDVLGWKIIPIFPNSKSPVFKQWNKEYDKIVCRNYLQEFPESNIGFLLGDVIDVEADSEVPNLLLTKLTSNSNHPRYISEKSIHHLFNCHDKNLTRVVLHGIEFRGKKHQSLLPPSRNANGIVYTWDNFCDIPKIPDSLLTFYNKCLKKNSVHVWDRPTCYKCHKKVKIMRKRFDLERKAFYDHGLRWQCHKCREIDVREYCKILRKELY